MTARAATAVLVLFSVLVRCQGGTCSGPGGGLPSSECNAWSAAMDLLLDDQAIKLSASYAAASYTADNKLARDAECESLSYNDGSTRMATLR